MRFTCRFTIQFLVLWFAWSMPSVAGTEDPGNGNALSPTPVRVSFLSHHLQFLGAENVDRFRYIDKGKGKVTDRDLQYRISTRVQVNLVGEGTTYIQARGESGHNFTGSFDYTGLGPNKAYWSFNLKSLFLGQKIGHHLEAQAGGIEYDWGAGTEATYADNDAWLEGYRLRYTGAGQGVLPDKVSATIGYVGDFLQPNAFARLHRMGDENYVQILASKKLGRNRDLSAEFDSLQSISYTREALHWQKLHLFVVDELSVEALTRFSDDRTFGFSSSLFRTLDPKGRLRAGVFYSDMPVEIFLNGKVQVLQNGDSYALGKRIGPTFRFKPFKDFEVSLFGSDRLDNTPGARYRGQVAFRYQFASLLNKALR
jgi:hypothetical protein